MRVRVPLPVPKFNNLIEDTDLLGGRVDLGRVRILELDGCKNPSGKSYNLEGINLSEFGAPLPITTRLSWTTPIPHIDITNVIGFGTNLIIEDNALQCDIKLIDSLWPDTSLKLGFHAIMLADNGDPHLVTHLCGIMMSPLSS